MRGKRGKGKRNLPDIESFLDFCLESLLSPDRAGSHVASQRRRRMLFYPRDESFFSPEGKNNFFPLYRILLI